MTKLTPEQVELRTEIAQQLMAVNPKLGLKAAKKHAHEMILIRAQGIEDEQRRAGSPIV